MPAFRTEVPHQLGKDKAIDRLQNFLDKVREKYRDQVSHLEGEWKENQLEFALTAYNFKISGTVTVEDDAARVEGQIPFAAVAFRGKIQDSIADGLAKALETA